LSGKTQNGWTASPGSFCVRVRGDAQRRGWWHSWNLVAISGSPYVSGMSPNRPAPLPTYNKSWLMDRTGHFSFV
jgi:hypothetical protein